MITRLIATLGLACALTATVGCGLKKKAEKDDESQQTAQTAEDGAVSEEIDDSNFSDETMTWLKASYEKAKGAGEKVPGDVKTWAKEDVKKIGAWDYRIVTFDATASNEAVLEELQTLGDDRWNCFFVEMSGDNRIFYFKKSKRSYLQMAGSLSKLIPVPGSGGGSEE